MDTKQNYTEDWFVRILTMGLFLSALFVSGNTDNDSNKSNNCSSVAGAFLANHQPAVLASQTNLHGGNNFLNTQGNILTLHPGKIVLSPFVLNAKANLSYKVYSGLFLRFKPSILKIFYSPVRCSGEKTDAFLIS